MAELNFIDFYRNIFSFIHPETELFFSGLTYKAIYENACAIKKASGSMQLCICTDSKPLILSAMLASIAGGPSLILPHSYSSNVIEEIKNDTGFGAVLTDFPDKIPAGVEIIDPALLPKSEALYETELDPDKPFIRLFTGGSTGKSKIWSKTARNLFSEAIHHANVLGISSGDRIVSTAAPQHIYGLLFSVIMPFVSSAKIADGLFTYPHEIISAVNECRATVLISIPMHYRVLGKKEFAMPGLKTAVSSGGRLDFADAEHFHNQTGVEILELFGSTETGGIATRYNKGEEKPWEILANIQSRFNDERLAVKSEFISPDIPKEDGFFLTEDRAEKISENSFWHFGRADSVVKVAGKRVDLNEVESVLKNIQGVKDAIVIALESPSGRGIEIAALIEGEVVQAVVRHFAAEKLEPYAVPRKIKITDKIPAQATGKHDRAGILALLKS